MRKNKFFRQAVGLCLAGVLLFAGAFPASAVGEPLGYTAPVSNQVHTEQDAPAVIYRVDDTYTDEVFAVKDQSPETTQEADVGNADDTDDLSVTDVSVQSEDTVIQEVLVQAEETVLPTEPQIIENENIAALDVLPQRLASSVGLNELSKDQLPVGVDTTYADNLNSFTTVNSDGTNTLYIFNDPIKYIDATTGEICFIDNSIVPGTVAADTSVVSTAEEQLALNADAADVITGYTNRANTFSAFMPMSVNDGISLQQDQLKVTLFPVSVSGSTALLKNAVFLGTEEQVVEYANVFGEGIHLQYVPINNGIKENIVLENYTGINTFEFILDSGEYYPLYTEGEAIPFVDPATGETAFILGQVDARDSYTGEDTDGHFTIYNSLLLESMDDGSYRLTVTVDPEFLADPDTVYPVIIDPSVTISASNMQDTTVYSGHPDKQTYYSSAYNVVGYHGSTAGTGTAFIKPVDMSGYSYILPGDITSATYRVYEGSGKTNSVLVRVGRPRLLWSQDSVTDGNKPRTDPVSFLTVNKSGWKSFDITDLAQDWMNYVDTGEGWRAEYGFTLEAVDSSASSLHFCSADNSSYAPSFIINYDTAGRTIDLEATYTVSGDAPFKAFGYAIHGISPEFKINITTAGTYYIQTLGSLSQFGEYFTTVTQIELLDGNRNAVSLQSLTVPTGAFSYASASLSQGTYYLRILNGSGTRTNVRCYVIMTRSGELEYDFYRYANETRDFYKVADATKQYKCLGYVVRDRESKLDLPLDESTAVKLLVDTYKCEVLSQPENPCLVLYGLATDVSKHIVIIEWNLVKSKMGNMELVRHSKINAYYSNDLSYGYPISFYSEPVTT